MQNTKYFKPKAHILRLLGNELIKSPIMAIYELVKNSYDADSRYVTVDFKNIKNIEKSIITIEDNGTGLTSGVIENVWLEPGTDHRKPIDENGNRIIKRSPIFQRILLIKI
jgi:DNA topoisomerase VI subunit B